MHPREVMSGAEGNAQWNTWRFVSGIALLNLTRLLDQLSSVQRWLGTYAEALSVATRAARSQGFEHWIKADGRVHQTTVCVAYRRAGDPVRRAVLVKNAPQELQSAVEMQLKLRSAVYGSCGTRS